MSLPPILYHHFRTPLPYLSTLALQERLHALQLSLRRESSSSSPSDLGTHPDILLLLQHRPVYTAGRRQGGPELESEEARVRSFGADFCRTSRGGELTYHGPGQLVGYPLLDLRRRKDPGARDYICALQTVLNGYLKERHGVTPAKSEHTGVFLDERTKVASIGVQVRHRLTSHGFAINVTDEPRRWFDRVVACGLVDVKAGSVQLAAGKQLDVHDEAEAILQKFGSVFGRELKAVGQGDGEVNEAVEEMEEEARKAGEWLTAPKG